MADSIWRYEVPIDDLWHALSLSPGQVLHVAARRPAVLDLWALRIGGLTVVREFLVVSAGQPLPNARLVHAGTAVDEPYVWHLLERAR